MAKRRQLQNLRASERVSSATPKTWFVIGVVIAAVFVMGPNVASFINMQTRIAQLKATLAANNQAVIDMQAEKDRWSDPVYIRAQARDRLYYVMPGEISYLVMDAQSVDANDNSGTEGALLEAQKNTSTFSQSISTTKVNWSKAIVQSVLIAGLGKPANAKH